MAAAVAVETAETAMAIAGKTAGGATFRVPAGKQDIRLLEAALIRVCEVIQTAEELLTPNETRDHERASEVVANRESEALELQTMPVPAPTSSPRGAATAVT